MSAMCRHCRQGKINRPRGLCWTCFYTPLIKAIYPSQNPRSAEDTDYRERPIPQTPTVALPGTQAKVEVMADRARFHESIFHPQDARL